MKKCEFSAVTAVLSHMIIPYYADLLLKKHFLLLSMLKTSLNIFLWKFLRIILMIQKFKSIYIKTEIFCNIIVNFDQFNAFLKNESINWSHVSSKTLGYVQHIFFKEVMWGKSYSIPTGLK